MVRSFPRPVIATSTLSLFSAIIPVSAHVKIPFRPRAHAAVFQQRSPNDVVVEFARRRNVPREVRELTERGLLDDPLGVVNSAVNGGVTVVVNAGNGVTSVLGDAVNNIVGGGTTTTTTPNPPANSTPVTTSTRTQGSSGGNTGNPGVTTTNGSGNPTTSNAKNTQNTQSNAPSATASNPSQQTPNSGSGTRGANGSTGVAGTGSLTRTPGASDTNPTDTALPQNAFASGNGNVQRSTIVQTKTHLSTLPDGSVSTSIDVTTSTVDVPGNGNNQPGNEDKSPSPVLIAVIVTFFVLLLLFGIGLFIWRRRKRQAIRLAPSVSSFGSASDEWAYHARDSTMVGLGGNAASMGSGGAPVMTQHKKLGTLTADPFARRLSDQSYSLSVSSSRLSLDASNIRIPPDHSPVLDKFSQYPTPGSYTAFANVPESSSEGHGRSAAYHYEASTETIDPPLATPARPGPSLISPATPTTEQSFHTAPHEQRRARSPAQRLSAIESIRTPRASVLNSANPFGDGTQVRPSVDSGASIAVDYMRPVAPSPLASTFGPSGEPQPSSPFVTGTGRDAESVRTSYLTRQESFATAKSNKTGSTITLSPAPTRGTRGGSVSTSTDEFYSATSHESPSLSYGHATSNGQTSSSGHYITAPENPFADPSPQGPSEDNRFSTVSQASEASQSDVAHARVVQHRGTSARAEVVAARPPRSPRGTQTLRPTTGHSSSGQSIISSEPDPDAARCVSPDESELFYRPLYPHRERDERPSDETTAAEEVRRPIAAKAKKILGVHT